MFDRLFLGAMALGVVNFAFRWNETEEIFAKSPEMAAVGFGTGFMVASFVGGMAINLIIWYFISARASKVAKWIQSIFYGIGLLSVIVNLNNPLAPQGAAFIGLLIIYAMYGGATYMLFRPDAVEWFNTKPVDPGTFR